MPAIPVSPPPWNIFDVASGAPMAAFTTYTEVLLFSPAGTHFDVDALPAGTGDFIIKSGPDPLVGPGTCRAVVDVGVPDTTTLDLVFKSTSLPNDFTTIADNHLFIGTVNQNGIAAGFFFSKVGITYTGSVNFVVNDLKINSALQLLPNSLDLVKDNTQYALRVAVDLSTKITYVYITEFALLPAIGHQLRFILPGLLTADGIVNPGDQVVMSVGNTTPVGTEFWLHSIRMGDSLVIPNLPPVADPGRDQAIRSCTIAVFDGRASFDPEGAPLFYDWRLIDGPDASTFVHPGDDGHTTGFVMTSIFYSEFLFSLSNGNEPDVGDVLLYNGVGYNIIGKGGTTAPTFYVQIDGNYLPPGLSGASFKLLKNNALSNRTSDRPSFYPDVPGLFRFDLTVFDGDLYSPKVQYLVNVTDSPVPRGITPDVSFLWGYISDFWKLVDNTEVIETFWSALSQIAASELLTLWQHDYSKSLRDIQRTFQRKWLHYDPFLRDPFPDSTVVGHIYGSVIFTVPAAGIPVGLFPYRMTVSSSVFESFDLFLSPAGPSITSTEFRDQLLRQLAWMDTRFTVERYTNGPATEDQVQVKAPFDFTLTGDVAGVPFSYGNNLPSGNLGVPVAVDTYRVERRVDNVGVKEGDFLILSGTAYRILRVITDPTDPWPGMRVVLKDKIPITAGSTWKIARGCSSTFIDYYTSMCSAGDKAVIEIENTTDSSVSFVQVDVLSAGADNNSRLLLDTDPLASYLFDTTAYGVHTYAIYRRTYLPIEPLVVGVPILQEKVKNDDDTAVLRQNVDYYVDTFRGHPCLRFLTSANSAVDVWQDELPPPQMWAEVTYVDNRPTIEANFGIPAQFTLDDLSSLPKTADYLSIVQGLWYLYFTGPTLYNLRAGTQILLGLPFAEVDGVIAEIRDDFTSSTGRILVTDATEAAIVRSYTFPAILDLEINPDTGKTYAVGDSVKQFAPLVQGVEVTDYVKDPKWFEGFLNQGDFYEVEKFFKFLVRIDSAAFSLNTLVFIKNFINRIKPTYTYPLYIVLKKAKDATVDVTDELAFTGYLKLNEWTGDYSYPGGVYGINPGNYDDPRPAFGGWRRGYDSDGYQYGTTPAPLPVYPTSFSPTHWGFDREALVPRDVIVGLLSEVKLAPFLVAYDGLFQFDMPTFTTVFGVFAETFLHIPANASGQLYLGDPQTVAVGGSINYGTFYFRALYPVSSPLAVFFEIIVNGTPVVTVPYSIAPGYDDKSPLPFIPIVVSPGDVVQVRISSSTVNDYSFPGGARFFVALGSGSVWAFDTLLPAATYYSPRPM